MTAKLLLTAVNGVLVGFFVQSLGGEEHMVACEV